MSKQFPFFQVCGSLPVLVIMALLQIPELHVPCLLYSKLVTRPVWAPTGSNVTVHWKWHFSTNMFCRKILQSKDTSSFSVLILTISATLTHMLEDSSIFILLSKHPSRLIISGPQFKTPAYPSSIHQIQLNKDS